MATEYKKVIFMGMPMPSDKCVLAAIPMSMYRVQTNRFTEGLNYFQKAVLKLKFMPQISNQKISELLNLDERLVNIIIDELEAQDLLTSTGYLTPKGEEARRNASGLIIDDSKKQMGYVFTYNGDTELYPYYHDKISFVEMTDEHLVYTTDKVRQTTAPIVTLLSKESNGKIPTETEILQLIKHSSHQKLDIGDVGDDEKGLFQVKIIPDNTAEQVLVCTYVYLPKLEDSDAYEDDWQVLDPFGNGNSYDLKSYLGVEANMNKEFANVIFATFKDAETENSRIYSESLLWFDTKVDERISVLFGEEEYNKLSSSVQKNVQSVVKAYLHMELGNFNRIAYDQAQIFFLNMQASIESILRQDQIERAGTYIDLENNFGEYASKDDRISCLRAVYRKQIISDTTNAPKVLLFKKTEAKNWKGKSLLDYLLKFIMTISVEPNYNECPIYGVFKNRIEKIVAIAEMRNHMGHGNLENTQYQDNFSQESIEEYFEFFCNLVTDYINIL